MPRIVAERADALPALAEVFREHGYEGASLSLISAATGLGKGSLYHFFPGGKEEMARAVLAEIDAWFEQHVFSRLRDAARPEDGIAAMLDAVDDYFRSGRRVCLVGALALGDARDRFAREVGGYFSRWVAALAEALTHGGREAATATALAEEIVADIQGAIVLSRALDDPGAFARSIARMRRRYGVGQ
jgi:TetR/AcrR family transcriptional regulator, lmrAB and yxaGH operons repressor